MTEAAVAKVVDNLNPHILSATDILSADDREIIEVEVPEWKGKVRLRLLTTLEALEFMDTLQTARKTAIIRIVILTAVDKDGRQLFEQKDLEKLGGKSLKALKVLERAALIHNGLASEATIAAAELEATKNALREAQTGVAPTS